jgi:hypothetical protein
MYDADTDLLEVPHAVDFAMDVAYTVEDYMRQGMTHETMRLVFAQILLEYEEELSSKKTVN